MIPPADDRKRSLRKGSSPRRSPEAARPERRAGLRYDHRTLPSGVILEDAGSVAVPK